ncbi:Spo0B domain-containing protein [Paenibacillus pinistramenti]|uniref:Spo0B domain-containing protein n=1 Tax=Paenibacillus pinistramenti TaxID=1768003 RepID=UPI0011084FCC|nr:Spo0B domain-containing protein [Paenibacillus pinistramenti]
MKDRRSLTIIAGILLLIPLVLFYFNRSVVGHIGLCLWVGAVLYGYWIYIRRQQEADKRRLVESVQRTATSTLARYRHDWMNDLQILYGYIQLGKYDKLRGSLDRIKERMAAESHISRLGIQPLVFYLQSFREMNPSVQLEVSIEEGLELGQLLDREEAENWAETVMETIRAYQFAGRSSWGETLQLNMSIYREGGEVVVRFELEGGSGNSELLKANTLKAIRGKRIYAKEEAMQKGVCELRMPLAI